jgi:hypothetical protein
MICIMVDDSCAEQAEIGRYRTKDAKIVRIT